MHIAETREQARANVRFGLGDWLFYFREVASLPLGMEGSVDEVIEKMIAQRFAVIGTPDDAIEQLERLQSESGGFGAFLQLAHNWEGDRKNKPPSGGPGTSVMTNSAPLQRSSPR